MIEIDKRSVSSLLSQKGVSFTELNCLNGELIIGLSDLDLDTVLYLSAIVETLGLKGAWIMYGRERFYLGG
jgi:hypothetical protein